MINELNINWLMVGTVFIFIIFDFISGFLQALANKNISSTKLRQGLFHDCGFFLAVALAILCDYGSQYIDLGFEVPICALVCTYICLTEIVSIVENICKLAPELKNSKLITLFASILSKNDKKD